jgi:hypothetical protein
MSCTSNEKHNIITKDASLVPSVTTHTCTQARAHAARPNKRGAHTWHSSLPRAHEDPGPPTPPNWATVDGSGGTGGRAVPHVPHADAPLPLMTVQVPHAQLPLPLPHTPQELLRPGFLEVHMAQDHSGEAGAAGAAPGGGGASVPHTEHVVEVPVLMTVHTEHAQSSRRPGSTRGAALLEPPDVGPEPVEGNRDSRTSPRSSSYLHVREATFKARTGQEGAPYA